MNPPNKLLLAALAALALVVALVVAPALWTTDDAIGPPDPGGTATASEDSAPPPPEPRAADAPPDADGSDAPPAGTRREVVQQSLEADSPQGVEGRLIDPSGAPVADAEVLLFEGNARNPLAALLAAQRGATPPPIGSFTTDATGRFAIPVQRVSPSGYELRVTHPDFANHAVPDVTLFPSRWTDLASIVLDRGVALEGRIVVQGGGSLPVANATVTVKPSGAMPTVDVLGARDPGHSATTDAAGLYRVEHCPAGLATVVAVAPGFARVERQGVQLQRDQLNRVDLELPKGSSIAGVVTDADGRPVEGASVEAYALSAKTPVRLATRSNADGRFEVIGLTRAPYQLTAWAPGFVRGEVKPVAAGSTDEHIVLQRQSTVLVAVKTPDGRPIQRFDVELKGYDRERDQMMHVPSARLHRVVPDDLVDGFYPLSGLDPGIYTLKVEARDFAKTFSKPFEIELGSAPRVMNVTMQQGGTLAGTVLGQDGNPLADVTVETRGNGFEDNALTRMFAGMMPERITRASTRTGPDGRFEFDRLTPGTYQARLSHPAHFELSVNDLIVAEGQSTDAGRIRLGRGAELSGTATVDGVPAGQIRVTVSSVPDPTNPGAVAFMAETTTDDEGRFRLSRRLPPGEYQARAARQSLATPLLQVLDFAKTREDFRIAPGQESQQIHFSLTSN
jgi:protocatechuate 3,4-dioxygenase beta subunit